MVTATPSVIERLPPHNLEAEQSVLGSLLIDRDAIIRVAAFLRPEDFYIHANDLIYQAILDLYNRREPTDFVTLSDELQRRSQYDQAGGLSYLSSLLTVVPTAVHVEYYARIVERAATLRRLIDAGTEIVDIGFREGVETEDALDSAERAIFAVSQRRQTKDFVSMKDVINRFFDQMDYLQQHRGEVIGVATGFSDLDQLTGGLQRSDLIIVAGRPSMGKSSLALGMAYGAAIGHQKTVGIFSLEMSAEQLVQRILAMETGIDSHRLRLGQIDDSEWDRMSRAFGRLSEAPIYIDDTAAGTLMDIRSKARRLQAETGLDLIIVDYLQLMTGRRSENRVQEVSEISRGLKGLARELNVPVVALSQLSRAVESRSDHRPMLSDLRESGCLTGDTPVYLPDSGEYVPIAELCRQDRFQRAGHRYRDVEAGAAPRDRRLPHRPQAGLPPYHAPRPHHPRHREPSIPDDFRVAATGRDSRGDAHRAPRSGGDGLRRNPRRGDACVARVDRPRGVLLAQGTACRAPTPAAAVGATPASPAPWAMSGDVGRSRPCGLRQRL